jgi:hypothetical protein
MHARLQTTKAKRMKTLRSSTVEPVLGNLVNYFGMRRVKHTGYWTGKQMHVDGSSGL